MYILWNDIRIWEYVLKIFDRNLIKIKKNPIVRQHRILVLELGKEMKNGEMKE